MCEFVYLFMLMIWKDCDMRMAEGLSMITKTQDDKNVNYDKDDQGWPLTFEDLNDQHDHDK